MLVFPNQTSLDATYQACTQLNVLTAPPLDQPAGDELGHGRDVLHVCTTTWRRRTRRPVQATRFPGNMANMAMQVPPSSNHPGGVNVLMGDASGRFIKNTVDVQTWRNLGTRNGGEVISADAY